MEDTPTWKTRLQSKTVRALVLAAVVTCANAFVAVSGVQVDVDTIQFWSDVGLQLLGEGFTLALLWKAYTGRVNATTRIDTDRPPLPWLKKKE